MQSLAFEPKRLDVFFQKHEISKCWNHLLYEANLSDPEAKYHEEMYDQHNNISWRDISTTYHEEMFRSVLTGVTIDTMINVLWSEMASIQKWKYSLLPEQCFMKNRVHIHMVAGEWAWHWGNKKKLITTFKAKSVTRTVVQLQHAIYTKVTSASECLKTIGSHRV